MRRVILSLSFDSFEPSLGVEKVLVHLQRAGINRLGKLIIIAGKAGLPQSAEELGDKLAVERVKGGVLRAENLPLKITL